MVLLALAGCNSSRRMDLSQGLTPPADIPGQNATDSGAPAEAASPDDAVNTGTPANTLTPTRHANTPAGSRGTIAFKPVIGAPLSAVQPMSAELGLEARENGLLITSQASGPSDHILVGYLSAFPEGKTTTVAFVWDILDSNGTRLHRIRGQEKVSGTASDPWSIVPPKVMKTIADRTISEYLAWRAGSGT